MVHTYKHTINHILSGDAKKVPATSPKRPVSCSSRPRSAAPPKAAAAKPAAAKPAAAKPASGKKYAFKFVTSS